MTTKKSTLITVLLLLLMAGGTLYHYQNMYKPISDEMDAIQSDIGKRNKELGDAKKQKDALLPDLKKQWDTLEDQRARHNKLKTRTLKAASVRYLNASQVQQAATYIEALLNKNNIKYQTYNHIKSNVKKDDQARFEQEIYKFSYTFACRLSDYLQFAKSMEKAMKGENNTMPLPIRFSELKIMALAVRSDRFSGADEAKDVGVELTLEALYRPHDKPCEITWDLPEAEESQTALTIAMLARNSQFYPKTKEEEKEKEKERSEKGKFAISISSIIELIGEKTETKVNLICNKERAVFTEGEPAKKFGGRDVRLVNVIRQGKVPVGATLEYIPPEETKVVSMKYFINGGTEEPPVKTPVVQAEGAPAPAPEAPAPKEESKDDADKKTEEKPASNNKTEEENK